MERLQGDRSNSFVYIDNRTQHMYYRDHVYDNGALLSTYFVCEVPGCNARIILNLRLDLGMHPEIIEDRRHHNHDPDPARQAILRFKQQLRHRAENERIRLRDIFTQEERNNHNAAMLVGGFAGKINKMMDRARKRGVPPIPRNFQEWHNCLRDLRYTDRLSMELGPLGRAFYRGLLQVNNRGQVEQIIYFVSPTIEILVRNTGQVHLHMDGTFRVVPAAGGGLQLFTIHLRSYNSVFPIVYAIMQRKTKASYDTLLETVRDTIFNVNGQNRNILTVTTDYETALRDSIHDIFPNARLIGCWFHYCKAVYLRGRQLGLTALNHPYEVIQGVKMGMALALLPAHLIEYGRGVMQQWMLEHAQEDIVDSINDFSRYMHRQWATADISVYRLDVRTNNPVESFHKSLNQFVGRQHPNVWMFVSFLQQIEHSKACDLTRLYRGLQLPAKQKPRWIRLNNRIRIAENRLENDGDIAGFLRFMSHAVDGIVRVLRPANELPNPPEDEDIPRQVQPLPEPALQLPEQMAEDFLEPPREFQPQAVYDFPELPPQMAEVLPEPPRQVQPQAVDNFAELPPQMAKDLPEPGRELQPQAVDDFLEPALSELENIYTEPFHAISDEWFRHEEVSKYSGEQITTLIHGRDACLEHAIATGNVAPDTSTAEFSPSEHSYFREITNLCLHHASATETTESRTSNAEFALSDHNYFNLQLENATVSMESGTSNAEFALSDHNYFNPQLENATVSMESSTSNAEFALFDHNYFNPRLENATVTRTTMEANVQL